MCLRRALLQAAGFAPTHLAYTKCKYTCMSRCAAAAAAAAAINVTSSDRTSEYGPIRATAARFTARHAALTSLPAAELCSERWILYAGDENYGLGNVLYDVASAAALAMALNRSLVYGRTRAGRKFESLLSWQALPSLDEVESLRRSAGCRRRLIEARGVTLAPDRCTFHRTWRRGRAAGRCLKRLLGTDWLQLAAPLLVLSKVHAFSGVQLFLRAASQPTRNAFAALVGGCLPEGGVRPNLFGALLAELLLPAEPLLHALRWALADMGGAPQLALHMRALSDWRAPNLTRAEAEDAVDNAVRCCPTSLSLSSHSPTLPPLRPARRGASTPPPGRDKGQHCARSSFPRRRRFARRCSGASRPKAHRASRRTLLPGGGTSPLRRRRSWRRSSRARRRRMPSAAAWIGRRQAAGAPPEC